MTALSDRLGKRVWIEWADGKADWRAFQLIGIDRELRMVKLQGRKESNGPGYIGGPIWVPIETIDSITMERE